MVVYWQNLMYIKLPQIRIREYTWDKRQNPGLDCLIQNYDITPTLTKFIIPACMDTVVELGLVESPGVGTDGLIRGWLNGCFLTHT